MSNHERFTTPSSFSDEPPATPWPEGVRMPKPDDPLYDAFMAAVYGFELNGLYWRINDEGEPEVALDV